MSYELNSYLLGDIATFQYGKMPKKPLLGTGLFPTYSGYKYQCLYPEFNCDAGDVIVVARGVGGTGDVKIVKEKCYLTKAKTRNNVVQEKKFADRLQETLRKYNNRAIETAQVIEELIQMAKEFQQEMMREAELG